jgi:hypothetical protein
MNIRFLKNFSFLFLLTIISCFFSCKKFLDEKPSNRLITPQKVSDLQALMDDLFIMNQAATPSWGEASSDDHFVLSALYNTTSNFNQNGYIWQPFEYYYPNDWSKSYSVIYNANYCLDMLKKQERYTENALAWDNVYGSALFFRAYYFFMLCRVHAKAYDEISADTDPGIVLRLTSDFNLPSKRASVEDSYQQILSDVKKSVNYLPDLPMHVSRPSKAAAYAFLARTYLYMRIYDSAFKYADFSLQIKNDLMDFNGDDDVLPFNTTYPFKKFNKETIFYTEMNIGQQYEMAATLRAKVDTSLYLKFGSSDLRKQAYFLLSDGYFRFRANYTQLSVPFTGLATDEMYLVRAECNARKGLGRLPHALSDLNALLKKRYVSSTFIPFSSSSPNEVLDKILEERRKELLFRDIRWSDIKRLNKEGRNIVLTRVVDGKRHTLEPNANYYALPLPSDIISLAGIEQNDNN